MHACTCVLSCVWLFATPWTVALPVSSVHGIFQARILESVAVPSSRGSSQPRDWTRVSCIAGRFFTTMPPGKPIQIGNPDMVYWHLEQRRSKSTSTSWTAVKSTDSWVHSIESEWESLGLKSRDWAFKITPIPYSDSVYINVREMVFKENDPRLMWTDLKTCLVPFGLDNPLKLCLPVFESDSLSSGCLFITCRDFWDIDL